MRRVGGAPARPSQLLNRLSAAPSCPAGLRLGDRCVGGASQARGAACGPQAADRLHQAVPGLLPTRRANTEVKIIWQTRNKLQLNRLSPPSRVKGIALSLTDETSYS